MRDYEVMTIHRPEMAEDEIATKVGDVEKYLTDRGASITNRDIWGKRRFVYEIDHLTEGYYSVISFKSGTDAISDLDRALQLTDEVVRHKIVRLGE